MEGLTTGDLQEGFKAKRENHINCYLVNFSVLSNMSKAIKKKKIKGGYTENIQYIV